MRVGYKTDKGNVRENNEDHMLVDKEMGLFIVTDGMGGPQGGEVASKMAVDLVSSYLSKNIINTKDVSSVIENSVVQANKAIKMRAEKDNNLKGMGTTIVFALYHNNKIYITNVGDSRIYLIRNNKIKQITKDHSLVAELIDAGDISKDDARKHHLRHILSNAIGVKNKVQAEITEFSLENTDGLLLCSDGLTDMITDKEIGEIVLKGDDPQRTSEKLVELANKKGGRDNITVVLVCNNDNLSTVDMD